MATEQEIIEEFKEDLKIYPFKFRMLEEYYLEVGRVDMFLQDYNVTLEFKGENGNIKKAIGQALSYKSCLDSDSYIVLPHSKMKEQYLTVCKESNIGVIVYSENMRRFSVVNDVGGLEAFSFAQSHPDFEREQKQEGQDYQSSWVIGQGDAEMIEG